MHVVSLAVIYFYIITTQRDGSYSKMLPHRLSCPRNGKCYELSPLSASVLKDDIRRVLLSGS
jgi:hypothetical protein